MIFGFGSGLHRCDLCWMHYSKRFGIPTQELMRKLWGDYYFDSESQKFISFDKNTNIKKKSKRAFDVLSFGTIQIMDGKDKVSVIKIRSNRMQNLILIVTVLILIDIISSSNNNDKRLSKLTENNCNDLSSCVIHTGLRQKVQLTSEIDIGEQGNTNFE